MKENNGIFLIFPVITGGPYFYRGTTGKLTHYHLQIVKWLSHHEKHKDIWNQESATAVFVSGEREPPNVAKSDGHRDARHQKFHVVAPGRSFLFVFHYRLSKHFIEQHKKTNITRTYLSFKLLEC